MSGVVTTQTSEPVLLDTWNTPYAIGPADHALFLTVSPDWQKNLFYDTSGQYGCVEGDGGIINCKGDGSDDFPSGAGSIKARQIYSRVTSIALHVHYVHPSDTGHRARRARAQGLRATGQRGCYCRSATGVMPLNISRPACVSLLSLHDVTVHPDNRLHAR